MDRGVLDQQLQALGESGRWWDHREMRDLPSVLHAEEQVLALSRGKVGRVRMMRRSWMIVVTDRRLLCLRSTSTSWRQLEVAANRISRVTLRVGLFRGRLIITAEGTTYRILVPRPDAYRLQSAISTLATSARPAITGFGPTRMVRGIIEHVLALPAAALNPDEPPQRQPVQAADNSAADARIQMLEDHVQQLQQQVDFLEQLLTSEPSQRGRVT